jgi:hypothetical protein
MAFLHRYKIHAVKEIVMEHLQKQMNHLELDQLPKIFKLSLAVFFSKEQRQELPEGHESAISLLNPFYLRLLRKHYKNPTKKSRVLWDLLQSKDLAVQVPKSMIQAAFEKHQRTLTAVGVTPCHILTEFRTRMRDFCQEVLKEFRNETTLPPQRAYFRTKRSEGGCRNYYKSLGLINSLGFLSREKGDRRIDPPVLHICGPPGKGKSFLQEAVIAALSRRFGYFKPDVYSRTVGTDHWDGYRGQLIASIDDAFSAREDEKDCLEIIQICSNLPYVLPMAKLEEKGRKFTSDFLFISSNFAHLAGNVAMQCLPALRRRIYPTFELLERRGTLYRIRQDWFNKETGTIVPGTIREFQFHDLVEFLVDYLVTLHSQRKLSSDNVNVPIVPSAFGEPGLGLSFPVEAPQGVPTVKAVAIPEPLKVRMITKGEEETWVLKPVQKAMWRALGHFDCFRLTQSPDIPLDLLGSWSQGHYLLSGDYESATDNLNMDIMQVAVDELKKVVPQFYHSWLNWEGGPHDIEYPDYTGLLTVRQTRGQLMGSLLSFPILCVANATTIGIAQRRPLSETQCLINGDDILFTGSSRLIGSWKRVSRAMGLIPSIGKNYCSPTWGSINSQLIIRDSRNTYRHVATGLFGPTEKVRSYKSCIYHALRIEPDSKPSIVIRAKRVLVRTPESLDIPVDYGGLGVSFDREPTLLDKEIYFFKLTSKGIQRVGELDDFCFYRVPKHLLRRYESVLASQRVREIPSVDSTDEDTEIFPWTRFRNFQKWYKGVPCLRDRIRKANLPSEIPLRLVKSVTVRVPRVNESFINNLKTRI